MSSVPVLGGLREVAPRFKLLVCDIWGVLHNGHSAFPGVVDCLNTFRAGGGYVLLLSNAPRPSGPIRDQLHSLGVPETCYDTLVTSGDLTRELLAAESVGGRLPIHHVGPDRDLPLFEGLDVDRVPLDRAQAILCTGPFDDTREGPDDYRAYWTPALERGLPFWCANPDLQVQRGNSLIYCAGALAADYERRGGKVTYLGKPHAPAYSFVERRLEALTGQKPDRAGWLAVGDGLKTDILGATRAGFASLLITGGIHEAELSDEAGTPDPARIARVYGAAGLQSVGAMRRLAW
jgi:HAD superfamily hydrolase (TIGR01459 family)